MTIKSVLKSTVFLFSLTLLISACGGDNNNIFSIDYSDAPDLPDTTNAVSQVSSPTGLVYYVIAEGVTDGFEVTIRDDISVFYTTRTGEDEIVGSSYANGSTSTTRVNNIGDQSAISFVGDGFVEGVLGMKEGEHRVLVIPDSLTTVDEPLTLDIKLETIEY